MKTTAICSLVAHERSARLMLRRWNRRGRPQRRLLWSLLFSLSLPAITTAQQGHPTELQVKAAYLYNFGKFVRWPADRDPSPKSREICVLGKDPFGAVLDATVAGESMDGRPITVRRLANLPDAPSCSILFVSTSEENRLYTILSAARGLGVLTVSDIPHFAERGGTIGFVVQQGRIRFEVNRDAAEQSHIGLSSELLKVATRVIGTDPPRGQP